MPLGGRIWKTENRLEVGVRVVAMWLKRAISVMTSEALFNVPQVTIYVWAEKQQQDGRLLNLNLLWVASLLSVALFFKHHESEVNR